MHDANMEPSRICYPGVMTKMLLIWDDGSIPAKGGLGKLPENVDFNHTLELYRTPITVKKVKTRLVARGNTN